MSVCHVDPKTGKVSWVDKPNKFTISIGDNWKEEFDIQSKKPEDERDLDIPSHSSYGGCGSLKVGVKVSSFDILAEVHFSL